MDIAERTDLTMKACGIADQSRFAREAGISVATLTRILSGAIKQPSAQVMAKIAKRGGVDYSWLVLGENDEATADLMQARIISHKESELITMLRSMSSRSREMIFAAAAARLRDESN